MLIFTADGCAGCSMVEAWRASWLQQWQAAGETGIRLLVVSTHFTDRDIRRGGITAVPTVAVVDQRLRVRATALGFNRGLWNHYVAELLELAQGKEGTSDVRHARP